MGKTGDGSKGRRKALLALRQNRASCLLYFPTVRRWNLITVTDAPTTANIEASAAGNPKCCRGTHLNKNDTG